MRRERPRGLRRLLRDRDLLCLLPVSAKRVGGPILRHGRARDFGRRLTRRRLGVGRGRTIFCPSRRAIEKERSHPAHRPALVLPTPRRARRRRRSGVPRSDKVCRRTIPDRLGEAHRFPSSCAREVVLLFAVVRCVPSSRLPRLHPEALAAIERGGGGECGGQRGVVDAPSGVLRHWPRAWTSVDSQRRRS